MLQENIPFSGNRGAFAFLLHGGAELSQTVRDHRLPAGMGKAGASPVALRVLLVGIVQAGPDAELQRVLELSLGFCRGRALSPDAFLCGKRGEGRRGGEPLEGGRQAERTGATSHAEGGEVLFLVWKERVQSSGSRPKGCDPPPALSLCWVRMGFLQL